MNTNQNEGDAAAVAAPDAAAAAAAAANVAAPAGNNALAAAAGEQAPALGPDGKPVAAAAPAIPEKYQVKKADGSVDEAASLAKLLEGHKALETKLGSGEGAAVPKTPEEYTLEGVEGLDAEILAEIKADPLYQDFRKKAHGQGITDKQMSFVISEFIARQVDDGLDTLDGFKAEAMQAEGWGSEPEYKANMALAYKAARAYLTPEELKTLPTIPNPHPMFMRILARAGKEVGEDRPASDGGGIAPEDFAAQVAALRAHPAHNDANHPEHKTTMAKITALYEKRYPKKPR